MDGFHEPTAKIASPKAAAEAVVMHVSHAGNAVLSLLSGLLAAALILYSGFVLYDTFYTQASAARTPYELLQLKPEIIDDGIAPLSGQDRFAAINEDYRAWLTLYETNIDYAVMQGEDNLFYASHDVYGEVSLTGSIYLASENTENFSDSYNLIYGHHMDNGAMFGGLDEYRSEAYLNAHREGMLVTGSGIYDLTIFAVAETDAYEGRIYSVGDRMNEILDHLRTSLETGEGKTRVLSFDEGLLEGKEKIAAFSTCAGAETNGRLVVIAVLAVVAFILTENMKLPMALIDRWSPLMILLLVMCWIIDVRLLRRRGPEEEEEMKEELKEEKA